MKLPSKVGLGSLNDAGRSDDATLEDLNPQGGSPLNTFTSPQLEHLRNELSGTVAAEAANSSGRKENPDMVNILDPNWAQPDQTVGRITEPKWFGAPRLDNRNVDEPRRFRQQVRQGQFSGPTNGVCPGVLQCNMVVLPRGQHASDFLLFCQVSSAKPQWLVRLSLQ